MLGWWGQTRIWRTGVRREAASAAFLQPAVLALLSRGPTHGYQLLTSLVEEGFLPRQPDIGHLYRVLRGMEARGLVTSEWVQESVGPLKRVYTITEQGRDALRAWVKELQSLKEWLEKFLEQCKKEVGTDVA